MDFTFKGLGFLFGVDEVPCDFKSFCELKSQRLKTNQTRLDRYRDSLMSKFRRWDWIQFVFGCRTVDIL